MCMKLAQISTAKGIFRGLITLHWLFIYRLFMEIVHVKDIAKVPQFQIFFGVDLIGYK